MNILLVGGSGFIGRALVQAFVHQCTKITVVSRQAGFQKTLDALVDDALTQAAKAGRPPTPRPQTQVVVCDLIEEGPNAELVKAARVADVVTYSLQFPGHPVQRPEKGLTYARYDAGGLGTLLDGPLAGPDLRTTKEGVRLPPRRLLYVSGAGAGQGRPEPWFRAKDEAEALGQSWAARTGGSFLSLRPSVVFGANDVSLNTVYRAAKLTRVCPLFGRGDTLLSPVWVDDLARAFARFGPFDPAKGGFPLEGAFDLPGPKDLTFRQVLETMFDAAGLSPRPVFLPVPIGLAKAGAFFVSLFPKAPLTPEAIDFLTTGPALSLPPQGPERDLLEAFQSSCTSLRSVFESTSRRD
jgi:nucleoside-diphosphate-sugar epimerase